jgi:hypothetical protein
VEAASGVELPNSLGTDEGKGTFVSGKGCAKQGGHTSIFIMDRVYIERSLVVNGCTMINPQTEL